MVMDREEPGFPQWETVARTLRDTPDNMISLRTSRN